VSAQANLRRGRLAFHVWSGRETALAIEHLVSRDIDPSTRKESWRNMELTR